MTNSRLRAALRVLGVGALTTTLYSVSLSVYDFAPLELGSALVCAAEQGEVREWTDSTGKFKVEATFVSQNAEGVTLRKTDGRAVRIPFAKLSKKDKNYLSELEKTADSENPFAGGTFDDSSSEDASSNSESSDGAFALGGKSQRLNNMKQVVKTGDLTKRKKLKPAMKSAWKVNLTPISPKKLDSARAISIASNPSGKSGYANDFRLLAAPNDASRLYGGFHCGFSRDRHNFFERYDLASGNCETIEVSGEETAFVDVSADGKYALAIQSVPGSVLDGKEALLAIYSIEDMSKSSVVDPTAIFYPFVDGKRAGYYNDRIENANWLDSQHIVTKKDGDYTCWDLRKGEAVYSIAMKGVDESICLDPTRSVLAVCAGSSCGFYNALTGEALGVVELPDSEISLGAVGAFSPSGTKFAVCLGKKLFAIDLSSGAVTNTIEADATSLDEIVWANESAVLVGSTLFDLELGLPLCDYAGADGRHSAIELGGYVWFAIGYGNDKELAGYELPHKAALDAKTKLSSKDAFLIYPGASVSVSVETNGLLDEKEVRAALEDQIKSIGLKLDPKSKLVVKARVVDTKREEDVSYGTSDSRFPLPLPVMGATRVMGTIKLKVFEESVSVYDGSKKIYEHKVETAGPRSVEYDPDKKIEDSLRESNVPELSFFAHAYIPRYISKDGRRAGMTARITTNGIR